MYLCNSLVTVTFTTARKNTSDVGHKDRSLKMGRKQICVQINLLKQT